jgi:hypothetical protein
VAVAVAEAGVVEVEVGVAVEAVVEAGVVEVAVAEEVVVGRRW